jgi:hypothetical protein
VAAVECPCGTEERDLDTRRAPGAEEQQWSPALVHGAVAQKPCVGLQEVLVPFQNGAKVRRPDFLLTLEEDLQIDRRFGPGGCECVEGGQQSHDRRLVVSRRTSVKAPFRSRRASQGLERDGPTPRFEGCVTKERLPGRVRPRGRFDRLTVVVCVHDDRTACSRGGSFAIDHGWTAFAVEEASRNSTTPEQ